MKRAWLLAVALPACAAVRPRDLAPGTEPPPLPIHCADRGPPVAHRDDAMRDAARSSRGVGEVVVTPRSVVYRDAQSRLVRRSLADGSVRATVTAAGLILYADEQRVVLWRHTDGERRVVRVAFDGGRELPSDPLPLPTWTLASTELEPTDEVTAWPESDDIVLAWSAITDWRGGYPPSPEERERAHHEDCGSLRIDAVGHALAGGMIWPRPDRVAPSPVPARNYLQQTYAGDGLWWLNDIDPTTGAVSHAWAAADGTRTEVRLPAAPAGSNVLIAGVWATGDRVVVLRVLRVAESYQHARELIALDRHTGAQVWAAPIAALQEVPPRP